MFAVNDLGVVQTELRVSAASASNDRWDSCRLLQIALTKLCFGDSKNTLHVRSSLLATVIDNTTTQPAACRVVRCGVLIPFWSRPQRTTVGQLLSVKVDISRSIWLHVQQCPLMIARRLSRFSSRRCPATARWAKQDNMVIYQLSYQPCKPATGSHRWTRRTVPAWTEQFSGGHGATPSCEKAGRIILSSFKWNAKRKWSSKIPSNDLGFIFADNLTPEPFCETVKKHSLYRATNLFGIDFGA